MNDREQALVEAARELVKEAEYIGGRRENTISTVNLRRALKAYAAEPQFCVDPARCAGTGSCTRDPACND